MIEANLRVIQKETDTRLFKLKTAASENPQSKLLRLIDNFATAMKERTEPIHKGDLFQFFITEYRSLRSRLQSTRLPIKGLDLPREARTPQEQTRQLSDTTSTDIGIS
jgi:hypothetical protein